LISGKSDELKDAWNRGHFSMRLTGEPATCLANSLVNLYAAINSWDDAKRFEDYGLKVKFRKSEHVTFLKGVFLKNENNLYTWTRLPSFLLKFGKVLTNPAVIHKKIPYKQSCKMLLRAQWLGYGNLGVSNWFYNAIQEQVYRLSENIVKPLDLNEFQITQDGFDFIPDDNFNSFMLERYNLDHTMLLHYIKTLSEIKEVPCIYTHPIMKQLLYDYI